MTTMVKAEIPEHVNQLIEQTQDKHDMTKPEATAYILNLAHSLAQDGMILGDVTENNERTRASGEVVMTIQGEEYEVESIEKTEEDEQ